MSKHIIDVNLINSKENIQEYNDKKYIAKVKGRVDENPEDPYLQHEIKTPFFIEDKTLIGEQSTEEDTTNIEN